MKKGIFRVLTLLVLILPIYLTFFANSNQVKSVPVINLKDQLSNAQLSFSGRILTANGTVIKINTATAGIPSRITANLATGDTIAVADVGVTSQTKYIVRDIGNTAAIEISSSIGTTTTANGGSYVIATRSAIHTVTFTPQAATAGEIWQFLIKATDRAATGEYYNDGMPDQTGFDIGSDVGATTTGLGTRLKTADITCPFGATASVGSTVMITSGVNIGATGPYNIIQCTLGAGVSNNGAATSITVGRAVTTGSQLNNPAPGLSHVPGLANGSSDTFAYAIRQLDSGSNILDTTFGRIAVTESVRVTAIVDPTITFTIGTSNTTTTGTNRCGSALSNYAPNTTATSVDFGPLVLGTFNNLAQSLHCTTNSQNGYVIQTYENAPMRMLGATTTIPDTNCNGGGCSPTVATAWATYTNSGFGYSLEVGSTSAGATLGITTSGNYKAFGVGNGNAQTVMSRTNTPAATDSVYICYRTVASTTQQAGTYENSVSFIATATF